MKARWVAYVIVAVSSIGAGVAIAGLPDNVEVDPIMVLPATTVGPSSSLSSSSTTTTTTSAAASSVPSPSQPESTTAPLTSDLSATSEPEPSLPDRNEIVTVTANGASVAGAATRWSELLQGLGYVSVQPHDGTEIVDLSVVYFAEGFEEAAMRLAEDMALLPQFVAPLDEAPEVLTLPDGVELLAYVGLDRA